MKSQTIAIQQMFQDRRNPARKVFTYMENTTIDKSITGR
jgi:hypothetical protein